jgi:hypothetical protein
MGNRNVREKSDYLRFHALASGNQTACDETAYSTTECAVHLQLMGKPMVIADFKRSCAR